MEFSVYLMFNGDCEAAINFYVKALGAEMKHLQRFGESPMATGDPEQDEKILHCGIEKDGFMIMASDNNDKKEGIVSGNNVHVSVNLNSESEIENVFNAISEGGTITMPLEDTFWGAKFGMCTDKFGIGWMFNYDKPQS